MKKMMKTLAMLLIVATMLSMTAFAAPQIKPAEGETVSGTPDTEGKKFESITYENGAIKANGQYMIFVTTGGATTLPTASTLLYINQVQAAENGKVTFTNVYPKSMTSSGILVSGTDLETLKHIADILAALLGDVDLDTEVTTSDAATILRAIANDQLLEGESGSVADTDRDTEITTSDAAKILRFVAGLIDEM